MYGGLTYDSKRESEVAEELDILKHARGADRVDRWERQVKIPIIVNAEHVCDIIPDFFVCYADGRKEFLEVKSDATTTPLYRLKRKLLNATFLKYHPDINYRVTK
jgi:hypothetical protein